MDLIIGNLAGFWALLGIPTILAIHLFQQKRRKIITSTLFLLERLPAESVSGRRLDWIRNSATLWFQILSVLMLTWLLIQPKWLRPDSSQTVVVVLDSSFSMSAFKKNLESVLSSRIKEVQRTAKRTKWIVIETDLASPTLYSGQDPSEVLAVVQKWEPHLGFHDLVPALNLALSLQKGQNVVLLVSDHLMDVPEGVVLLTVGESIENFGFAGITVNENSPQWQALLCNYGSRPQTRHWWIESKNQKTSFQSLSLKPGEILTLEGKFPENQTVCELVVEADRFAMDDRLPILIPSPKNISIRYLMGSKLDPFLKRFLSQLPKVTVNATNRVHLELKVVSNIKAEQPLLTVSQIRFLSKPEPNSLSFQPIVNEDHELVRGLNWQNFLCDSPASITLLAQDQPLLWKGGKPLIFLRETNHHKELMLNFDFPSSNAERLPAFVLLLHRFIELVRNEQPGFEANNVELNQSLVIATSTNQSSLMLHRNGTDMQVGKSASFQPQILLRTPAQPGFFQIKQGDQTRFSGAAHFADTREADLKQATSFNGLASRIKQLKELNTYQDRFTSLWLLILLGLLIGSWNSQKIKV